MSAVTNNILKSHSPKSLEIESQSAATKSDEILNLFSKTIMTTPQFFGSDTVEKRSIISDHDDINDEIQVSPASAKESSKRAIFTRVDTQAIISKIMESEECVELFGTILNSSNFSNREKINVILDHINIEQRVFKLTEFSIKIDKLAPEVSKSITSYIESPQRKESIANAQIDFAHALINEFYRLMKKLGISKSFIKYLVYKITKEIDSIERETSKTQVEKAKKINEAITNWLKIQGNPLKRLTKVKLRFRKKGLKAVLPCISKLPLVSLDLSGNKITSLPRSMANLEKLEELYIGNNLISFIPDSIARLTKLSKLIIHKNRLMAFDSMDKLVEIEYLDLSYNQIMYIGSQLGPFTKLKYLDLSDNLISSIKALLGKFPILIDLDLRNNNLTEEQIQKITAFMKKEEKIKRASKRVKFGSAETLKVKESSYPTPARSRAYPTI